MSQIEIEIASQIIIEDIYASVFDFDRWQSVVDQLDRLFPGSMIALHGHDVAEKKNLGIIHNGIEDSAIDSYVSHFASVNPYMRLATLENPSSVIDARDILEIDDVVSSEFYNDWMTPQLKVPAGVGLRLRTSGNALAILAVNIRLESEQDYGASIRELFHRIEAPARFAIEARRSFNTLRSVSNSGLSAPEDHPLPTAVIGGDGRIEWMSKKFAKVLKAAGSGMSHSGGGLRISDPRSNWAFEKALASARSGVASQPFSIPREGSSVPRVMVALPTFRATAKSELRALLGDGPLGVTVMMLDPVDNQLLSANILSDIFDITPAEARVCDALASGLNIDSYAKQSKLSRNTVRNQLSSAMSKIGVRRQSELAGIISRIGILNTQ